MTAVPERRSAVAFDGVCKSYGSLRANQDVSFDVRAGSVHAVIGENGAGKSTLMRMLAGAERPDTGTILIDGVAVDLPTPRHAAAKGVGMVYQDLKVLASLTVWENVVLAFEPRRLGVIDRRQARGAVAAMIDRYRMSFSADAAVSDLSLAQRQQVEILRLLYRSTRILILDEPTAILTPAETQHLFAAMRLLRAEGRTVLFISHKLPEILEIADEVTVMRDGRAIETADIAAIDRARLVRMIVGRDLTPIVHRPVAPGPDILRVEGLGTKPGRGGLADIGFSVAAGTIFGIAGVAGNGQDQLFAALAGMEGFDYGRIRVATGPGELVFVGAEEPGARPFARDRVRALREGGVAIISQDRRGTGSAAGEPLWFSTLAGRYWRWHSPRLGLLDIRRARETARSIVTGFAVKTRGIDAYPQELSGGNLQKFIVGREIMPEPRLLIAEDPTRGVDIGSSRFIRQQIRQMADRGTAVVLISTDLEELIEVADEIMVLAGGKAAGRFRREEADAETLGRAMTSGGHGPGNFAARSAS